MATIPGGIFDSGTNPNIDPNQGNVISGFLTSLGLSESNLVSITPSGNSVVQGTPGGFMVASGSSENLLMVGGAGNDTVFGRESSILISSSNSSAAIQGTVSDGAMVISISLPAGQIVSTRGPESAVSVDTAKAYLNNLISEVSNPGIRASLTAQLETITRSATGNVVVRVLNLVDRNDDIVYGLEALSLDDGARSIQALSDTGEIRFDGSLVDRDELLVFNLNEVRGDKTLVLKGVESAGIIGAGNVRVDDASGTRLVAGIFTNRLEGGAGADTLVGGGGYDTLTGGAGADEFGINAKGHTTITDLNKAQGDTINIDLPGVVDFASLAALVTKVTRTADSITYHLGDNGSITLVGVDPAELTASLFTFNVT